MEDKKDVLPEQYELLEILKTSFYSVGGRTKQDRYVEFNNVFMGSDEGKRVLYEILGLAKLSARLVPPAPAPVDKDRMLIREGARQLAADILDVLTNPHNEVKPTKTNRKQ
jgi:hypothetical protein